MYLDSDRRPPITPQLAIRVAIIGGAALVMFGVIFFRLWYLQVLSGDRYLAEANNNRVREITVQAPRGKIVDRNGQLLVGNRTGYAVQVTPDKFPEDPAAQQKLYAHLARLLHMRKKEVQSTIQKQFKVLPFSAATVKQDVPVPVLEYVLENNDRFPGVQVEQLALRYYPQHDVGAHLFGTVGQITQPELKDKRYRGVKQGDRVGQSGIEYSYDRYLRGVDGATRLQVDARGTLRGELAVKQPQPGEQLRLGVDLDVERTAQQAMGGWKGGFVAMDVSSGQVVALGSSPSFDPNIFSKAIKESDYKRLSDPNQGAPLSNRAIQGLYPTGSTFKLITATAAMMGHVITPDTVLDDPGSFHIGGITFKNAGGAVNGALALRRAIQVSSDVFFYQLGADLNGTGNGLVLQKWANKLGLGHTTGIDLPAESSGLIPSPQWRNRLFKKHLTDRPWSVGDNVNLAVGQGDVEVDPLQLAVAYATIANGGYVVTPHLGERIEDTTGRVIQEFRTPRRKHLPIPSPFRQAILDGLRAAAGSPGGTSYPVFKDFPIPVAGKTGTAQRGAGRADQSWYVGMAPFPHPKYVVVATAEGGGFGVQTAAPIVRQILATLFNVKNKAKVSGGSNLIPAGVNPYG